MQRIGEEQARELLTAIFKNNAFIICEYVVETDTFVIYDEEMNARKMIPNYLEYLEQDSIIHPQDRQKVRDLYLGKARGQTEIRIQKGDKTVRMLVQILSINGIDKSKRLPLMVTDITKEKTREEILEEQATKDALTSLYNYSFGRKLISEYLQHKDPYATCGIMLLDIDYFKYVNDTYGHLFGDYVLVELARLLRNFFEKKDIVVRFGGDEFVIFLKDISHSTLVKRGMQLLDAVRELKFQDKDYSMTCSIGICYLPENESGYTYDQLFGNADWALYQAKEKGRDQYVFCDNLRRYELTQDVLFSRGPIDARYLHNDIISTAFEIFEKMNSFSSAIEQLMEIIGYRLRLDRITIIRTDIQDKNTGRQYQWTSEYAPEVLKEKAGFTKEDFLTHAAMYCEGKYTGAISYVACREKRYWSRQSRKELGEVTKIISAHLARAMAVNRTGEERVDGPEYDSLTGLLSFSRFRVELERLIIGNYAVSDYLLYMDFAGFKYFNQKYGYSRGDQLLREFCNYFIEELDKEEGVYFTRVVSDQFLMLLPGKNREDVMGNLNRICQGFSETESRRIKGYKPRVRIGIYQIEADCVGASYAIDAANYARKQLPGKLGAACASIRLYDEELGRKRKLENEIVNEIGEAIREQRFQVYLQPKISLEDGAVIGAEALARWRTREGKIIYPNQFIPLCESTGQIQELDFFVFEQTLKLFYPQHLLHRKNLYCFLNQNNHCHFFFYFHEASLNKGF